MLRAALCALAFIAAPSFAGTIGTATVADVTLGGTTASLLSYGNGINPQSQGRKGGSIVFGPAFSATGSGAWVRLAAFGSTADNGFKLSSTALGNLTMSFDQTSGRTGTWTLTNDDTRNNVEMDLVFAMHTGGGSGAFLFDEQVIGAGQTLRGTWALNLLNNGGQFSGYSNLTLFGRDLWATLAKEMPPPQNETLAASEVPEPATLGSMLLGLAMMGALARKRT